MQIEVLQLKELKNLYLEDFFCETWKACIEFVSLDQI